ncbi:OmpH family outer membrane protein [Parendozoicomonas sp. Alg238-R29]|uniref:OmpH family outer membrane protein n=1 Tax=Parendozoicomonas sp. Alg238-R29 TaxID=2993446 RepID=UPI00248E6A5F|nr:OmpH family outer membrane protein [Parendozoicomonas sp. Alg238-R29]
MNAGVKGLRSLKYIAMAAVLAAPLAQAGGIAVVNSQKALLESSPARAYAKVSEEKFSTQVKNLQKVEAEYREMASKLERDGATMSEAERSKVQLELRRKQEDFQYQARSLQQEKAQADQAELDRIRPKLEQAISAVAEAGGYDVIVEEATVRYSKPGLNITSKVIEKLNGLAKAK